MIAAPTPEDIERIFSMIPDRASSADPALYNLGPEYEGWLKSIFRILERQHRISIKVTRYDNADEDWIITKN